MMQDFDKVVDHSVLGNPDRLAPARRRLHVKMAAALAHQGGGQAKERVKALADEKRTRDDAMAALDHALSLGGMSLAMFLPKDNDQGERRATCLLGPDEERTFIDAADEEFPFAIPEQYRGGGKKSIIVDKATGNQRYELDEFRDRRPMLALCCDEGSKFYAALWFICGELQGRVAWLRDPGHRAWNDWRKAAKAMPWHCTLLELLVVTNMPFGPWLSEAFFQDNAGGPRPIPQGYRRREPSVPGLLPRDLRRPWLARRCGLWQRRAHAASLHDRRHLRLLPGEGFQGRDAVLLRLAGGCRGRVASNLAHSLPPLGLHGVAARVVPRWQASHRWVGLERGRLGLLSLRPMGRRHRGPRRTSGQTTCGPLARTRCTCA